jgi:UDP-3-O-[3-hydroxymyristoyl] glucosamine N-acyltransferase
VVKDPKRAFIQVMELWCPEVYPPGVHPTAVVEGELGEGVHIGPYAVIAAGARIGDGAAVLTGAVIGEDCVIGPRTVIFPRAVLYPETQVGADCRIHAGAVLGADGFSYHPTAQGPIKVPQVGRVRLGDRVEIGANTCVDRAFLGETVIGDGSALDNLVQVGHNSKLGRFNLLAAQVGVSGSVTFGDGVIVGGQAGFADHVNVGERVIIGSRAGVHNDLEGRGVYLFAPAMPVRKARRVIASLNDLPEIHRLVYKMARKLGLKEE